MEEQRRRRWGHASHEYYKVHGFLGSQNVAGASDSLGYYRVLGIDANAKVRPWWLNHSELSCRQRRALVRE